MINPKGPSMSRIWQMLGAVVMCSSLWSVAGCKGNQGAGREPLLSFKCAGVAESGHCAVYGPTITDLVTRPEVYQNSPIEVFGYFSVSSQDTFYTLTSMPTSTSRINEQSTWTFLQTSGPGLASCRGNVSDWKGHSNDSRSLTSCAPRSSLDRIVGWRFLFPLRYLPMRLHASNGVHRIGDGVGFDWSGVACARDTGAVKFGWEMGLGDRGGLLKPVDLQGPRHG